MDLGQLRELLAFMRVEGILYARCGELELRLTPTAPPARVVPVDSFPEETDPDAEERRSLQALLHSSDVDVDAFLAARKRMSKRAA